MRAKAQGLATPWRRVRLAYPEGFPARFIEAHLDPPPPREQWGMLGAHVNVDGSACYVAGEGWSPDLTAADAVRLLRDWWFNYWVIVERGRWWRPWPDQGLLRLESSDHAALAQG